MARCDASVLWLVRGFKDITASCTGRPSPTSRSSDRCLSPAQMALLVGAGSDQILEQVRNDRRDWCGQAELPRCSSHGLRKAGGVMLEHGAASLQLQASFGWLSSQLALDTLRYYPAKAGHVSPWNVGPRTQALAVSAAIRVEIVKANENAISACTEW